MTETLFLQAVVVILACAGLVFAFVKLGLPTVFGYLAAGILIGPHGMGLPFSGEGVRFFGDLGIVLLLFMTGLEFSLPKMVAASRTVFGIGGAQVALTTAIVAGAAMMAGFDVRASVVVGGVVAMSSTAIVLKQLAEQGELTSDHGRLSVGILLFQDLAALPFLVLVDAWTSGEGVHGLRILTRLAVAALAFGAVGFLSRLVFKRILADVARLRSNELMLLSGLSLALGTGFVTNGFGLSPPVGAFLAGMVVGETDFRHQIEDDIRPFRDVLVGVFFVTVGMTLDWRSVINAPLIVLAWLALLLFKAVLTGVVVRLSGWPAPVAARTAACLAQGGEFGLLLLTLAMQGGIVPREIGQPGLVAIALSIGLAPIPVRWNEAIGRVVGGRKLRAAVERNENAVRAEAEQLDRHVILLGCGRVGRLVVSLLEAARIEYLALEIDLEEFRQAKDLGYRIVLGDASRPRLLDAAGLDRTSLVVITFDHHRPLERILHHVRHKRSDLPTLVSAHDDRKLAIIAEAGASVVFPENLAAGLALGNQALVLLGLPHEEAARIVRSTRTALNPEICDAVGC
ncbi:MAG TPA: cation:proton antiporter [Bryobacteraceae bacterium]|nr:cation:proton antiporter [Bryobacteraceae bacterium]